MYFYGKCSGLANPLTHYEYFVLQIHTVKSYVYVSARKIILTPNASRFELAGFMQLGAILFTYITYLIKNIRATQEQQSYCEKASYRDRV